jgi:hypothetical protein
MSVSARWSPEFQQIIAWLTTADRLVRDEALAVVRDETEAAAREVTASVRRKSGKLARSVRTEFPSETIIVGKVRVRSPHSHLNFFGTKERFTRRGAKRGAMPDDSGRFVGIARARRSRIASRLRSVAERHGFTVKG